MATHAPRAIARQPFASLDGARLQRLQNIKNRQNALPTQLSPSTKRRYTPPTPTEEHEDAENIDPALLSPKRLKNMDHADVGKSSTWDTVPTKRSQFVLVDAPPSPDMLSPVTPIASPINRPIAKPTSRLNRAGTSAARTRPTVATSQLKLSSTAPSAGRSPKSKRHGILSKRRNAAPFFRVDPPTKSRASEPFSLDAALSGTIPGYSTRSRPAAPQPSSRVAASLDEKPMKEGWFFDIHEDTFEEALTNMMEFSTGVLDISDDEDRRREKNERGKENIPPEAMASFDEMAATESVAETQAAPVRSAAPMAVSKEPKPKRTVNPFYRAPLADLPTTDFYEESALTSSSFGLSTLSEEDDTKEDESTVSAESRPSIDQVIAAAREAESAPQKSEPQPEAWPLTEQEMPIFGGQKAEKANEEIQIWESESAAGDADNQGESEETVSAA